MDVSCTCQKLPGLPDNGDVSQGSPSTSEKLVLTRKGQVTSCIPTLGHTQASLVLLPELGSNVLLPFCQMVLITWALSQSHYRLMGLATFFFTKPKVTMENATVNP